MDAPWAKSGKVGHYSFFLADENDNDFVGWFDSTGNLLNDTTKFRCAAGATENDILEGVLYLDNIFNGKEIPQDVWVAVGTYQTQDGGALQWQVPRPPSGTIDSIISKNEFLHINFTTGVIEEPSDRGLPSIFAIKAYPVPFGNQLNLSFKLLRNSDIHIRLYNISGRMVRDLFDGELEKGQHDMSFECDTLSRGIYFITITDGEETRSVKAVKIE